MIDKLKESLDFFLHLDDSLAGLIAEYGPAIYLILFLIIFVETGLVVMPFLPGDSLLFAAGSLAAMGHLDIALLLVLLFVAAVLGDSLNYFLGKNIGLRVLRWKIGKRQLVKQKYIDKTHDFYEKHGPRALIIARFVPIVRTFAPFVAGIGMMHYKKFFVFNVVGAFIWIFSLTLAGYFFGSIPFVKENFELVVLGVIALSVVPVIYALIKSRMKKA